ncbi:unnamed protein product [Calicophoron daubneyi]|uniref:Gag protein n=1 Tax=Calicophoron daubneyi TaxID=300641 RepID=A0AAV2TV98_CALDB
MATLPNQNECESSDGEERRSTKRLRSGESVARGVKEDSRAGSEISTEVKPSDMMEQLTRAFSILASTSNLRRTPIPIPSKFNLGDNYRHWEDQVRRYLKHFPQDQYSDLILDLLNGEAYDRVNDARILRQPVSDQTFKEIRSILDPPGLLIEQQRLFHQRMQSEVEDCMGFATALRRLAERAFPEKEDEELDAVVLQQLKIGVRSNRIREALVLKPTISLKAALQDARLLEDLSKLDQPQTTYPIQAHQLRPNLQTYRPPNPWASRPTYRADGRWNHQRRPRRVWGQREWQRPGRYSVAS